MDMLAETGYWKYNILTQRSNEQTNSWILEDS